MSIKERFREYIKRKILRRKIFLRDKFPEYEIGVGSYGGLRVVKYTDKFTLRIGKYCSFAEGVQIMLDGGHNTHWVTTYPFNVFGNCSQHRDHPTGKGDVIIGSDVWIGYNATILSGVEIGSGAVVGANSTVTKNVPPYAIVAGNPAEIIKYRFSDDIIDKLMDLRWWDHDISSMHCELMDGDVVGFIQNWKK